MADLVPDLQHILFWMSNSIELLYFIQQKSPLYMQSMEEELDVTGMAHVVPQAQHHLHAQLAVCIAVASRACAYTGWDFLGPQSTHLGVTHEASISDSH